MRRGIPSLVRRFAPLATLAAAAAVARAQDATPGLFAAAPAGGYFVTDAAELVPRGAVHVGAALELGSQLLVVRDPATDVIVMDGEVVSERLAMHLVGRVGVHERLELGASLATALQGGDASPYRPALRAAALGDLRLHGKLALRARGRLRISGALEASLPTSSSDAHFGDRTASLTPAALAGARVAGVELAARLGYRLRGPTRFGDLRIDDEIVAGVAARAPLVADRVWIQGELYGALGVQGIGGEAERPLEALAGVRVRVRGPWLAQAGVGLGLTHGYGTAAARGVLTVGFVPRAPAAAVRPRLAFVPPEDVDPPVDEPGDPPAPPAPGAPEIRWIGDRLVLPASVLFDLDGAEVKPEGRAVLREVFQLWLEHPEWEILTVEGHTDVRGGAEANQALSERRAGRVRDHLVGLGAAPERVRAVGYGESRPVAHGTSEAEHAQNRRVEFVITRRRAE